ncbi:MAG: CatB-related O-acetyltransferase [Alphaproteobacteria bacterium]|nr:CatB-related O-acetyltransferase [Alphaproteobacteria bacterium]
MSENAMGCAVLLGGEHPNDKAMNHSLSVYPEILMAAQERYPDRKFHFSRGPVTIGSNVVISENCTILSGVTIGDGAVIGAGTVVTKDVPPFAIAAGRGEVIRLRFKEREVEALQKLRWWDFTPDKILDHFELIEQLPSQAALEKLMDLAPSCYRKPSHNYLLFSIGVRADGARPMACVGAEIGGVAHATDSLPRAFQFYVRQIHNPPGATTYLVKDIFEYCGLDRTMAKEVVTNP